MFSIKRITAAGLIALLLAFPLYAFAEGDILPPEEIREEGMNYRTKEAVETTFSTVLSKNSAVFQPVKKNMFYEGKTGKLVTMNSYIGTAVKKGDVLAEIRPDVDEVAVTEMELKIRRAKEELEKGEKNRLEEIRKLKESMDNTGDGYARRKAGVNVQKLEVSLEQFRFTKQYEIASLETEYEKLLSDSEIVQILAPIDGNITESFSILPGDEVKTGEYLYTIADEKVRLIKCDETSFRYGMNVDIKVSANGTQTVYPAKVVAAPDAAPESGMNRVIIALSDPSVDMKGWRVISTVGEVRRVENASVIPLNAVSESNGTYFVKILSADGAMATRRIVPGIKDQNNILVLRGIKAGDVLVIE